MSRPKIVVVEDEAPVLALICTVLYGAEMLPLPCQNGSAALEYIHATRPDLVVLDVHLPGMNGIKVFEALRADPETQDLPVVFCTANRELLRRKLPNYDESDIECITKPFNNSKLVAQVREKLVA